VLRVCLLSARFHPQRSGVGDYTYFLASAVARVGDDVGVLSGGGELDESFYPLPRHMRVHRVVDGWATKGLPDVISYPRKLDRRVLFNTCPIPLLGAEMAHARPVVAFDVGGVRDGLKNGVNGLLVRRGDTVGLAGAIEQRLRDQALRARLGGARLAIASRNGSVARTTPHRCWQATANY